MNVQYSFKKEDQTDRDISVASYDEISVPSTKKCKYCNSKNANQILPANIMASIMYWSYYWNDSKKDELINLTIKKIEKVYLDKSVCDNPVCKVKLQNDIRTSFQLKGIEIH